MFYDEAGLNMYSTVYEAFSLSQPQCRNTKLQSKDCRHIVKSRHEFSSRRFKTASYSITPAMH